MHACPAGTFSESANTYRAGVYTSQRVRGPLHAGRATIRVSRFSRHAGLSSGGSEICTASSACVAVSGTAAACRGTAPKRSAVADVRAILGCLPPAGLKERRRWADAPISPSMHCKLALNTGRHGASGVRCALCCVLCCVLRPRKRTGVSLAGTAEGGEELRSWCSLPAAPWGDGSAD